MLKLSTKHKKIIAGLGIAGGIGIIALLLKNRLGFNEPPVENWRRGKNNIRANRKSIAQLQAEARQSKKQAAVIAEKKRRKEKAIEAAEWDRRENIWRNNRAMIEALEP